MKVYRDPEIVYTSPQPIAYSVMDTFLWPPFPQKKKKKKRYNSLMSCLLLRTPVFLFTHATIAACFPACLLRRSIKATGRCVYSCKCEWPRKEHWDNSPRRDLSWDFFVLALTYLYGFDGSSSYAGRTTDVKGLTRAHRRHSRTGIWSSGIELVVFWHWFSLSLK